MPSFNIGQKGIASEDFHKEKQVTDISIDVSKRHAFLHKQRFFFNSASVLLNFFMN